ncbi:MAG TPA: GAF domain-containing protein, partial [Myxococcota bacterium]|nr:GAF domain-containing protein [Myxococcota bacterium]
SPVHLEYLRNMEVGASLTISLIRDEVLWGLVACHHRVPLQATVSVRQGCETLGRLASSLLYAKREGELRAQRAHSERLRRELVASMSQDSSFMHQLVRGTPNLLDLCDCHGAAALSQEGKWLLVGKVPRLQEIEALVGWLGEQSPQDVFATDRLPELYPPAAAFKHVAAGLLAASIPRSARHYVLWFRPEIEQTIEWAGNPEKTWDEVDGGCRLHPRKSFALWRQVVRNKAVPWRDSDVKVAGDLRQSIMEMDLRNQFQGEREARAAAESERLRFSLLAEASAALGSSLSAQECLERFASVVTHTYCDWCVVYVTQDGDLKRMAIRHGTPQGQAVANDLGAFSLPPSFFADTFLRSVLEDSATVYLPRVEDEWLEQVTSSTAHARFIRQRLGLESLLLVPLMARGKRFGAIAFARADRTRPFSSEDQRVAEELA